MKKDPFGARDTFDTGSGNAYLYRLDRLADRGFGNLDQLPFSIKVLLESVVRECDGRTVTEQDVERLATYDPKRPAREEIPFVPARVLLQDFTGVPACGGSRRSSFGSGAARRGHRRHQPEGTRSSRDRSFHSGGSFRNARGAPTQLGHRGFAVTGNGMHSCAGGNRPSRISRWYPPRAESATRSISNILPAASGRARKTGCRSSTRTPSSERTATRP